MSPLFGSNQRAGLLLPPPVVFPVLRLCLAPARPTPPTHAPTVTPPPTTKKLSNLDHIRTDVIPPHKLTTLHKRQCYAHSISYRDLRSNTSSSPPPADWILMAALLLFVPLLLALSTSQSSSPAQDSYDLQFVDSDDEDYEIATMCFESGWVAEDKEY
ncbi:hypothetical protein B0H13DRAFT_2324567 [Mycena leptocephala]|nr:hypothetical protein B0H13DRAFT_2324567 [Mycena leptocephala]